MIKLLRVADVREILRMYHQEKVSYTRMVELLNERANQALNKIEVTASGYIPYNSLSDSFKKSIDSIEKNISGRLSFAEIESLVQMKHYEDESYGNDEKRCAELIEMTRNKIGYTKKDVKKLLFYCQRQIEDKSKCDIQCEHCKEYYKPLEK